MAKSSYCYQQSVLNAPDKYADLRLKIRTVFDESSGRYGYRRIHSSLKNDEFTVSEKVVRRLMQEEKLIVPTVKRKKYSSYKGEITPAVPNVIERDFHAEQPNVKWLTDITEFHIPAGKIYLSPIIDCFDGLPVSWTIGTSPMPNWSILCLITPSERLRTASIRLSIPIEVRTTVGQAGSKGWRMQALQDQCQKRAVLQTIPPAKASSDVLKTRCSMGGPGKMSPSGNL